MWDITDAVFQFDLQTLNYFEFYKRDGMPITTMLSIRENHLVVITEVEVLVLAHLNGEAHMVGNWSLPSNLSFLYSPLVSYSQLALNDANTTDTSRLFVSYISDDPSNTHWGAFALFDTSDNLTILDNITLELNAYGTQCTITLPGSENTVAVLIRGAQCTLSWLLFDTTNNTLANHRTTPSFASDPWCNASILFMGCKHFPHDKTVVIYTDWEDQEVIYTLQVSTDTLSFNTSVISFPIPRTQEVHLLGFSTPHFLHTVSCQYVGNVELCAMDISDMRTTPSALVSSFFLILQPYAFQKTIYSTDSSTAWALSVLEVPGKFEVVSLSNL